MSRQDEDIYTQLSTLLRNRKEQVYDIEILPSGFKPSLLHDGTSIGITKAALVQAFLFARQRLFDFLKMDEPQPANAEEEFEYENPRDENSTLIDTEVILLFDPEHLTACNWRKRRLLRIMDQSQGKCDMELRFEISFTTSLLRSPLHRHSKSPTMWYHRLWVLTQLVYRRGFNSLLDMPTYDSRGQSLPEPAVSSTESTAAERILRSELAIVMKSGEQHPMNYYAFNYMRRFLRLLSRTWAGTIDANLWKFGRNDDQEAPNSQQVDVAKMRLLVKGRAVVDDMHSWCLAHPGDMSGWAFLGFLLEVGEDTATQWAVVHKTVQFALGLAWDGESLWTFVDESFVRFGITLDIDTVSQEEMATAPRRASGWRVWARWCKTCGFSKQSLGSEDFGTGLS